MNVSLQEDGTSKSRRDSRRLKDWNLLPLIAVKLWLIRAFLRHADVVSLVFGQGGELRANFLKVETGDLFVEVLRQNVNTGGVDVLVLPEIKLCERLVRE